MLKKNVFAWGRKLGLSEKYKFACNNWLYSSDYKDGNESMLETSGYIVPFLIQATFLFPLPSSSWEFKHDILYIMYITCNNDIIIC